MAAREMRTFGPPGTGKTTWLMRQLEKAAQKYWAENIIVASFTKAAAIEVAGRQEVIPESNIGTLHALCYRQLGNPPIAETKAKEFNERHPAFAISLHGSVDMDDPNSEAGSGPAPGDEAMRKYQVYRSRMMPKNLWPSDVLAFDRAWRGWCDEQCYIDFTGMIERCIEAQIPVPFDARVGFFDEAQDFTRLEFTIIRQWAETMDTIVLVGDDDQSIYGFKGASPDAFIEDTIPHENKLYLRESHRLPSAILGYSKRWIEQVRAREDKPFYPKYQGGSVSLVNSDYRRCDRAVDMAKEYVKDGKTVMFLASCGYMLEGVLAQLRKQAIPWHNPYRRKRGDWNPLGQKRGTSTVARVMAYFQPEIDGLWTPEQLNMWTAMCSSKGLLKRGAKKKLADFQCEPEFFSLMKMVDEFFEPGIIGEGLMDRSAKWLRPRLNESYRTRAEFPLTICEQHGVAGLSQEPKIITGTIHSVKGGEADVVFLFPDMSPQSMKVWTNNADPLHDDILRQFYVGMTRSKEILHLCNANSTYSVGWIPA